MQTIGERLNKRRGIAPGFDFLRIFLAVAVVLWHVPEIAGLTDASTLQGDIFLFRLIGYFVLAAFFALSGFLIAGSAMRLSLKNFLINRGLRIVPALSVEVVLCALILGPLVTTLTLSEYFSDPKTWMYFTNAVGLINWTLPGVFETHATDIVNKTLWTVPHEILCYVIMSAIIIFGLMRFPWLIVLAAAFIVVVGIFLQFTGLTSTDGNLASRMMNVLFVSIASRLYVALLLGIAVYLYRDRIRYSRGWMLACAVWCWAYMLFSIEGYPISSLFVTPPLVYLTICIGVTDVPMPGFLRRGDYSYGIYLYGWPMQQLMVHMFPDVESLLFHFVGAMLLTLPFAMFSWHMIERPLLQLRKKFSFVSNVRLEHVESPASLAQIRLPPER